MQLIARIKSLAPTLRLSLPAAAVAFASLLVFAVLPAPALAGAPLSWSGPQLVDHQAPFTEPAFLADVSCPSTGLCVAVDSMGNVVTSTNPSGGAWTVSAVRPSNNVNGFYSVSCPSTSFCIATDLDGNVTTTTDPTGGPSAWHISTTVAESYGGLSDVSCTSASFCAALGGEGIVTSTDPAGGADAWQTSAVGAAAAENLRSLACASVSLCLAASPSGETYVSTDPTGPPSSWTLTDLPGELTDAACPSASLCVVAGKTNVFATTNPTGGAGAWTEAAVGARAISCPSASLCFGYRSGTLISSSNPTGGTGAWTATATPIDPDIQQSVFMNLGYAYSSGAASLSCPSTTFCAVVDISKNVLTSTDPTGGSGAWTLTPVDNGGLSGISALSCPSSSFCAAVDGAGNALTSTDPSGSASAWHAANIVGTPLAGISCVSTSFCAAVTGNSVLTSTNPTGGVGAWQTSAIDPGAHGMHGPLRAISCPTASFCVATDGIGNVLISTDPTGGSGDWTLVEELDPHSDLSSASCTSITFCALADENGNLFTSTNPTGGTGAWVKTVVAPSAFLAGLSCAQSALCVAVGPTNSFEGVLASSADPLGGAGAWTHYDFSNPPEAPPSIIPSSVSCPSTSLCVIGGYDFGDPESPSFGNIATSTSPASGRASWSFSHLENATFGNSQITAISCPDISICFAGDEVGDVFAGSSGEEHRSEETGGGGSSETPTGGGASDGGQPNTGSTSPPGNTGGGDQTPTGHAKSVAVCVSKADAAYQQAVKAAKHKKGRARTKALKAAKRLKTKRVSACSK